MVTCIFTTADLPINPRVEQTLSKIGTQQQMIDPEAGIARPAIPPIMCLSDGSPGKALRVTTGSVPRAVGATLKSPASTTGSMLAHFSKASHRRLILILEGKRRSGVRP
jgi:hypothetical protein